jgi:hypothetical protein
VTYERRHATRAGSPGAGKITVNEADQLLRAIAEPAPGAAASGPDDAARPALRWVRIALHKQAKEGHKDKDVNIRVPISIVRSGMRLGALKFNF